MTDFSGISLDLEVDARTLGERVARRVAGESGRPDQARLAETRLAAARVSSVLASASVRWLRRDAVTGRGVWRARLTGKHGRRAVFLCYTDPARLAPPDLAGVLLDLALDACLAGEYSDPRNPDIAASFIRDFDPSDPAGALKVLRGLHSTRRRLLGLGFTESDFALLQCFGPDLEP